MTLSLTTALFLARDTGKSMLRFKNVLFFVIVAWSSYLLVALSLPYLAFRPGIEFLATKQLIYHIFLWRTSFYIHVFSSFLLIICGAFQFIRYILRKKPLLHRISGSVYLSVLLILSGPAALVMSFYANGGIAAQISFVCLSLCWIAFTLFAYLTLRKKKYEIHGQWMLRSYALTLSAITLRFYAYLFDVINLPLDPVSTYILLAYASWIPNLLFAELMIRKGFVRHLLQFKRG